MSDKTQHTAVSTQQKMLTRYSDGLHHKHKKNPLKYRQHWRSHPCNQENNIDAEELNGSTGLLRELKSKQIRTRPDKGQVH